jgi:hypothetical protein
VFSEDNAATVCAHIRQGDFTGGHPLLPSTEVFTLNGLNYLLANVMLNLTTDNVGVLLFSDDIGFANNIARQIKVIFIRSGPTECVTIDFRNSISHQKHMLLNN